ncbi:MAG: hypothetical protein ACR2HO_00610 [Rubrobacteraceae bacterium]
MDQSRGLVLPERVRHSIASAVADRGVPARVISIQGRDSMRPPQGHVVAAAPEEEIDATRGTASLVWQL